jgi:DnaK suppressor protein
MFRGPGEADALMSQVLKKDKIEEFRDLLNEKRNRLLDEAKRTLDNEMVIPPDERMDEVDQASSEYMQAFSFRLRGRERFLMSKIEKALQKIDEGTYGLCEECEEPISLKRLQARPEAQLCIQCKEAQEKEEAVYADD